MWKLKAWELKDQDVMPSIAPPRAVQDPPICGLCRTPYEGDECPACKAEREAARRVIEETFKRDRDKKDRPISCVGEGPSA
jgi:hypothetical protein